MSQASFPFFHDQAAHEIFDHCRDYIGDISSHDCKKNNNLLLPKHAQHNIRPVLSIALLVSQTITDAFSFTLLRADNIIRESFYFLLYRYVRLLSTLFIRIRSLAIAEGLR